MNNTINILAKLSAMQKTATKLKTKQVKLGRVDELADDIQRNAEEVSAIIDQVANWVGQSLQYMSELNSLQSQTESLYQQAMETYADIQDLGLDMPQRLEDATGQAQMIVELSIGTLTNNLEAAEQILNQSIIIA